MSLLKVTIHLFLVALILTVVIGTFSPILAVAFIVSYVIGFSVGFILDKN